MLELNKIHNMDCRYGLTLLEDNSIDSIVTDPPYELGFMGKKWDNTGIAYDVWMWEQCLKVLKPGGFLLAFGGTRTYHRMACAIEDAGFEIRDQMQWIYGSGFPKSMDISKAIDKKFGANREIIGQRKVTSSDLGQSSGWNYLDTSSGIYNYTIPSTDEAQQWEGWGTALKPANEPIVVARKPLSEKTVADNVLKWGTGGINIDDCRVGAEELSYTSTFKRMINNNINGGYRPETMRGSGGAVDKTVTGRFPANVIFDEIAGQMLDEQSGISKSKKSMRGVGYTDSNIYGTGEKDFDTERGFSDSGGASRFFYCAKASKKERGEGNNHPTVKPLSLIKYLITLVTPLKGISLDPFEGSGTHAKACKELGFDYIGFEKETVYCEISENRLTS